MYRSKTMRAMPQNTRKLAHLLNEAESTITRLQNQIPIIESLEREVIAWNKRQEHYKNAGKVDPIKFD